MLLIDEPADEARVCDAVASLYRVDLKVDGGLPNALVKAALKAEGEE